MVGALGSGTGFVGSMRILAYAADDDISKCLAYGADDDS